MFKFILKTIVALAITMFCYLSFFDFSQEMVISINQVVIKANLLFIIIILMISVAVIIKISNIISLIINIPELITNSLHNRTYKNQLLLVKKTMLYHHLGNDKLSSSLIEEINDIEIRYLLNEIILKLATQEKNNVTIIEQIEQFDKMLKNEHEEEHKIILKNKILAKFPELNGLLKQKENRVNIMRLVAQNHKQNTLALLDDNLALWPSEDDFVLIIAILSSLNEKNKINRYLKKYWRYIGSYQSFNSIISAFTEQTAEEQCESVKEFFKEIGGHSWKMMLNYYMAKQHRVDLLDEEQFKNYFSNGTDLNCIKSELIYLYCLLVKGEYSIIKMLLQDKIEN